MFCILGILFVGIGILMFFSPNTVYQITENWKIYSDGDPSDLYIISTRIRGCCFAAVGVLSIITQFIK